ncbi:CHAP domain-containing protein [Gluconacetobacter entanii]|uniref:Amidase n=1 Tax=Gluconacetobacter entanii TaxID=108528 RepID=A0A318PVY9_9PROT|nr:CHAP domain-containing protein [Gluconacetobacter entanii]MCE2578951.1 CHAP domain-containing protein [Komagataeibacter sp. FNDCR1]MCW4589838.1 CHAP domain-containing protein [Gluconacetobacter entanii]MCW4592773.1 CHAP domain-containing protein [Gluconacetobacter entanii]NPC88598.1 CHAP domain-containing protein [Gluconacetobacter entanii]PYD64379.1 amidase [Gluconacetobacter entanii]
MRIGSLKRGFYLSAFTASFGLLISGTTQARTVRHAASHHTVPHVTHAATTHRSSMYHATYRTHRHETGHVIQCVAFAKSASNVMIRGNAADWWRNAAGRYARGNTPEEGSILNFRATRRMPLGHVAVVRQLVDSRTVIIDQSHWGQRGVSRNVSVIDVSPNNDWSAVRVALNSRNGAFGSIYPTYGFIYGRPEGSGRGNTSQQVDMMTAYQQVDRQPIATSRKGHHAVTEIAEAPEPVSTDSSSLAFEDDAPNRSWE